MPRYMNKCDVTSTPTYKYLQQLMYKYHSKYNHIQFHKII